MDGKIKFVRGAVFAALALAAGGAFAVTLAVDQVRQRSPWNGLVDIDYTISDDGTAAGLDDSLEIQYVDNGVSPAVTNRAIRFLQAPLPLDVGSHRVTWDANGDGVTNHTTRGQFIVKIVHYASVYMVIDVSGGSETNVYPVTYLNGAPEGGFNTAEYKGNKIVLRRIRPGSYVAGSPTSESGRTSAREVQHRVAISKPFYVGLFEITQQQYVNVKGSNPSGCKGDLWQYRPVETVSWNTIRGGNWPDGDRLPNTNATTFVGALWQRCKSLNAETGEYDVAVTGFDLPTEYQWEYACRAGTTGAFNTTSSYVSQDTALKKLGRYSGNQSDGAGGISEKHTIVGSYEPNPWGLYDMHGNVTEWTLDWFVTEVQSLEQYVDPVGPASGSFPVERGGSWNDSVSGCRSAVRSIADEHNYNRNKSMNFIGFRLVWNRP